MCDTNSSGGPCGKEVKSKIKPSKDADAVSSKLPCVTSSLHMLMKYFAIPDTRYHAS
jgi:hypothetical protein